jgi:ATP-dependent helicase HrpB
MTRTHAPLPRLPVSEVLPDIATALHASNRAVLSAPPGAGKTTLVPLFLLGQDWCSGKIILLEPRRLAARAAASRMASLLSEPVGQTVGYRMRLDNRVSAATRIEVVTEGVFARMILEDPELSGVSAVLFDEFHERSLDADFGLALALDAQGALREDLKLLVMSATLDVERVADLLGNPPVIVSEGRSFPIDIRHGERGPSERIEDAIARAILRAHAEEEGSILAFLPGQGEILRTAERLSQKLPETTLVTPLYGNLSQQAQDLAIRPTVEGRRKVVLATSIAETSITIDGVRIVIDSGLQRLPVFEPATGITRLETVKVSRASADQRAGRAGRTQAGIVIRLWHAGQTAAMPAFTPPQILASDLSGLALDLAHWGVRDPADLLFLDPPPSGALNEARQLLRTMGALDASDMLTPKGRMMRGLSLPPRLAAMAIAGAEQGQALAACQLAVLMTEQGLGGPDVDLDQRLKSLRNERGERADAARQLARRLADALPRSAPSQNSAPAPVLAGHLLMHAYPDRVALQRGARGRFVMANGRGAELPETERLSGARMLVIADLTGRAAQARILAAAEIDRDSVEAELADAIDIRQEGYFDRQSRQVRARKVVRLGAIILEETPLPRPGGAQAAEALADGVRQLGLRALSFSKDTEQLRARIGFLNRTIGEPWPDVSEEALLSRLDDWFTPFQSGRSSLDAIDQGSLAEGLRTLIPPAIRSEINRLAPTHFEAPTGQRHPIRYDGEEPVISLRVQELFGLKAHPSVAGGRLPLLLELTSPAHRPIQTTRDLPGFWAGSWRDVRADMRGQYPRHAWPEDPANAAPTARAKPRGT